jgi:hypothetical protein
MTTTPPDSDDLPEDINPALRGAALHSAAVAREHVKRLTISLSRARGLLDLHRITTSSPDVTTSHTVGPTDLLRAVVVFLHAALEDLLRTVAAAKLPTSGPEALDRIPLAGGRQPGEKFTLSQLAAFGNTTVADLIARSVREHLDRTSFNNTGDIASLLHKLACPATLGREEFPALDAMIRRRHQIVHQADFAAYEGTEAQPLSREEVTTWLEASATFAAAFIHNIGLQAGMARLRTPPDDAG